MFVCIVTLENIATMNGKGQALIDRMGRPLFVTIFLVVLLAVGYGIYALMHKDEQSGYELALASSTTTTEAVQGKGLLPGEEYIGQFRNEGKIATPKAVAGEYVISTETESAEECKDLEARVNRMCNPITPQAVASNSASIGYYCSFKFKCPQDVIDSGALLSLVKQDEIELDEPVFVEAATEAWGLDRIDEKKGMLDKDYSPMYDGSGQIVYVIDTGINLGHEEYKGRVATGKNMRSDGNENENDGNGHGTHCAGTVLGTKYGVAKKATLAGVRVLSDSGSGSTFDIIKGLEWSIADWKKNHKEKGCVLSLSLGGGKSSSSNKAVIAASNAGAIVVVAAGNSMADACNYSPASAGGNARTNFGVITVMASDSRDTRSSFSNHGPCTDIIAPGTGIKSAWKGTPTAVNTISGTSMATPHVAGVCAQLLQKHNKDKVKAMKELFTIGEIGVIKDPRDGSKNQLLQTPTSGIVEGPIPMPPAPPKIKYCVGGACAHDYTVKSLNDRMFLSTFNTGDGLPSGTEYPVIFLDEWEKDDPKACYRVEGIMGKNPMGQYVKMTGAAVFVERGGDGPCSFTDKVKYLQNRGAAFVIIYQDSTAVPFAPKTNLSKPDILIWSGMISKSKAADMRAAAKAGHKFTITEV